MTKEDYAAWCLRYCNIFLQDTARLAPTLAEWGNVFMSGRFTIEELNAALSAMAANPPDDRWQHLRKLTNLVRESRIIERRAEATDAERKAEQFGECTLCKSTGFVTVPDQRCVSDDGRFVPYRVAGDGVGTMYEISVYCSCGLGRYVDSHQEDYWSRKSKERGKDLRPWTLQRYEQFNRNWKQMLEEHKEFEASLARQEMKDKAISRTVAAVIDRVKQVQVKAEPEQDADEWLRQGAEVVE